MSSQSYSCGRSRYRVLAWLSVLFAVLITPAVAFALRVVFPAGALPTSYYWGGEFVQAVRAGYVGYLLAAVGVVVLIVFAKASVSPRSKRKFMLDVIVGFLPAVWIALVREPAATLARQPFFPLWVSVTVLVFLLWIAQLSFLLLARSFWPTQGGEATPKKAGAE